MEQKIDHATSRNAIPRIRGRLAMSNPFPIVLLVSDPAVRDALRFYLAASGFAPLPWDDCRVPPSSKQIVDAGCLIVDAHLPTADGLDLVEALRREGNQIPVVLLAGAFSRDVKRRAAGVQACTLLPLPFAGAALGDAIRALGKNRTVRPDSIGIDT